MALPLVHRIPGKYKQEAYYWRGGDVLSEREYLEDEFKKALAESRRAEFELRKVESEVRQASESLHEREEYTNALANFLDSDAEGGLRESQLKRRLALLEQEIKQTDAELKDAESVHHPAVASGLQKQKAYLLIENQRRAKTIDLSDEQSEIWRRQLAACTISARYRKALELKWCIRDLGLKRAFLRRAVNQKKKDFDATKRAPATTDKSETLNRIALKLQVELDEKLSRIDEKKQRRPEKWKIRIRSMIAAIDELNERMIDVGLRDDVVDTDALRNQYLPQDQGQQKSDLDITRDAADRMADQIEADGA